MKRYSVINHEFDNTGGNCMVSTFTVYDRKDNVSRYIMMNDEGFSLTTVDTIRCEEWFITDEERDSTIIASWSFEDLTCDPSFDQYQFSEEEFELYKYCQYEFYKKFCAYFKQTVEVDVNDLPNELYSKLGEEAAEWHKINEYYVSTDGYTVKPHPYFDAERWHEDRKRLQQIRDFNDWHKQQAAIEELYDEHYVLSFAGRSVKLPYDADVFSAIDDLLKNIIKEW